MNIGLIGYGFMGGAHASALQAMPGVTLAAVASRTRPSADAPVRGNLELAAAPLPADVPWTPQWQELVRDPVIDAVDICLPTQLHREVIEAAFAHGKHVLCEKPLALRNDDCAHLVKLAAESGRTFMVAQVLRWMFPYRYGLEFVQRHGAERIATCRLQRSTGFPHWSAWLRDPAVSGGATLDLLCHDLDQALQWFGTPESVRGTGMGEVDTLRAELRYPGDRMVIVEGGWLPAETPFSASYALDAGEASLHFTAGGDLTHTRAGVAEVIPQPEENSYREEIAYFVECCRIGAAPALCPPAESARAVELALLLEQSRNSNGKELPWPSHP